MNPKITSATNGLSRTAIAQDSIGRKINTRRSFVAGALAGSLAACGGGATAGTAPLVDIYGDSTASGSYQLSPDSPATAHLAERPAARIAAATGGGVIDHAIPGWTIASHAATWDLAASPASVLVLRFGGADAIVGSGATEFAAALTGVCASAPGKRIVLVGVIRVARKPEWQDRLGLDAAGFARLEAKSAELDNTVRSVAALRGLPFVDIRAVRFDGAVDIADAVHEAQAYSNRCADAIAAALLRLA